jgi:hypothetical protein
MSILSSVCLVLGLLLPAQEVPAASLVPEPRVVLGFEPGDDNHLARWDQVVQYCQAVDEASNRVTVRDLGCTTECRPFLVAIVTSEANTRELERIRNLQARIAQGDPDEAVLAAIGRGESRPVVLITNSIHSTEAASTLTSLALLQQLATATDPATLEILDRTVLLLVPSVNPDGVDIVTDWYERSRGKPWEGAGLPRLYHPYAGHDTNRDWFMLNLKETRLLSRLLYEEWFPTITYDVHQMGSNGARIFVPPFFDPVNPNIDPRVHQSIALVGAHMAADLTAAGRRGVLTSAMYDNWWNGGNRTTPQRHNMVGVLTESASVKLATPIDIPADRLRGATRGFRNHDRTANFPEPWPGGRWTLRDIVTDQLVCARSILTVAARFDRSFQSQYLAMGRDAVQRGKSEAPYGWLVPSDQADPGRAADLVRILHDTGIRVQRTTEAFEVEGRSVPAGSWLLRSDQPYRAHLKDMMERQQYPERRGPDGAAEPPYDVAGWTLPLLMGVEAVELIDSSVPAAEPVATIERPGARWSQKEGAKVYLVPDQGDDTFRAVNRWLTAGIQVQRLDQPIVSEGETFLCGTYVVRASSELEADLQTHSQESAIRLEGRPAMPAEMVASDVVRPRIGLYQPWDPSMDEGWTRLVFEQYGFPYTTLHNAEIRQGDLWDSFDVIVLPSVGAAGLRNGFGARQSEPEYVGGLGDEGFEALSQFVAKGGTLVALENSCRFVLEGWDLGVRETLTGLKSTEFYGPGSIVRLDFGSESLAPEFRRENLSGLPETGFGFFERSLAFEVEPGRMGVHVLASYAMGDPLASGWLLGGERLAGRGACVRVDAGAGRFVLFGFPPQHRGQTRGTYRLLFNALMQSTPPRS